MNDLISRQAAIEAVGEVHPLDYNAQSTVNRIKKIPSAQEWISVTERLPGRLEWVLCQCREGIVEVMVMRRGNSDWYHDPQHIYSSDFVTHWMPLPEPPKEEEGE